MYILAVGDYDTDAFSNKGEINQAVIWMVFFAATFMLQVTFMNMLIAIMGNTFEEVMEKKHQSAIEERIVILNDFRLLLDKFRLDMGGQYLFVIKPSKKNQLEESLETQVATLQETTEVQAKKILEHVDQHNDVNSAKIEAIQAEMHQMNDRCENMDKNIKHVIEMLSNVMENPILQSDGLSVSNNWYQSKYFIFLTMRPEKEKGEMNWNYQLKGEFI